MTVRYGPSAATPLEELIELAEVYGVRFARTVNRAVVEPWTCDPYDLEEVFEHGGVDLIAELPANLAIVRCMTNQGGSKTCARLAFQVNSLLPRTVSSTSPARRVSRWFNTSEPLPHVDLGAGVVLLGAGGYLRVPPSLNVNGKPFTWTYGPVATPLAHLPEPWAALALRLAADHREAA